MKPVLKVSLKKNLHYKYSNIYDAKVIESCNFSQSEIVDELLRDGIGVDKKTVLDVITLFNKKVAELVLSGNNVNTGLISLSPVIKGFVNGEHWNPAVNKIEISIVSENELKDMIDETTLEIVDENLDFMEKFNLSDQSKQIKPSIINSYESHTGVNNSNLKISGDPACGIAFRNWLWKA